MPPIILTILPILQAALAFAPDAKKIYESARTLFKMWFDGGLITLAQQQALRDWADAHEAATLAGQTPPELTVEPDPT